MTFLFSFGSGGGGAVGGAAVAAVAAAVMGSVADVFFIFIIFVIFVSIFVSVIFIRTVASNKLLVVVPGSCTSRLKMKDYQRVT